MRVERIQGKNNVYTCNVYLVRGEWNRIGDANTLIDVGSDSSLIEVIEGWPTGVGKKKIEQAVLTHSHSDHSAILPLIRNAFHPCVFASSPYLEGVDRVVRSGERLKIGNGDFEVIQMPGHSEDSISLYNEKNGILFSGDAPIIIRSFGGSYDTAFADMIKDLCGRDIRIIYPGHGQPITGDVREVLSESLRNIRKSINMSAGNGTGAAPLNKSKHIYCNR